MKLDQIFADRMVLAADKEIRIFGTGTGIAQVDFCGASASAESENEKWIVRLPKMSAGGPYEMRVRLNGQETTLKDVYVGRVYLLAGQSNAQFKLREGSPEVAVSQDALLRCFSLNRIEDSDRFHPEDGWVPADAETLPDWTMLGSLVGQEMRARIGEAVAMVNCYQGASGMLSWLPEAYDVGVTDEDLHYDYSEETYLAWNKQGVLYRSMFEKVCPLSFSGVIWYQGESDTADGEVPHYARWLQDMISIWRDALMDDELFFSIVQIADYDPRDDAPWHGIQEAQARAAEAASYAALVVSRDVCETGNIHPADKRILAGRIADMLTP